MESLTITHNNSGYDVVQLDYGKVNAIDGIMSKELLTYFTEAASSENVRGVILTGRANCFSAGLDIRKLFSASSEDYISFWKDYMLALQAMVRFPKPFIAAVTGYAPAGACVLACTADYRIMARGDKHVIGMHELQLGLQIPEMLIRIYASCLGQTQVMDAILNSKLFTADEAQGLGLVNEAAEVIEVLPKAEALMHTLLQSPDKILQRTKLYLRRGLLEQVDVDIEVELEPIRADQQDPVLIANQTKFIESLKSKKPR